jgi:predicted ATPase
MGARMKIKSLFIMLLVINISSLFCEPFKVVFTGGPGTGKTTLINALAKKGYFTIQEAAKVVIDEAFAVGNDQPWMSMEKFQLDIVNKCLALFNEGFTSAEHANAEVIFLDRAIPDGLAYFEFNGMISPSIITELSRAIRYDIVFVPDFLPVYESHSGRRECQCEAHRLHELLTNVYKLLNYKVIAIPAFNCNRSDLSVEACRKLDVEMRANFVLGELRKLGKLSEFNTVS